jgi:alpha-D-ribose 1-methylphosphonate 5-triphosphate synthase subunit PhnH
MVTTMSELPSGFADKVFAAQSTFRAIMEAMARPGSLQRVTADTGAPAGLMRGAAAIALALFDHDTTIWLDPQLGHAAAWLKFHTGAPLVADPAGASFALIADGAALPELDRFSLGSNEYPDRSTMLILQVDSLTEGRAYELRGPGIDGTAMLRAALAPDDLCGRLAINTTLFPRGIDVVLVHDDAVVAIPRTTRLAAVED